jgi:hypothetical protein
LLGIGKVVCILDGDTIEAIRDGKPEKVRLHGIDCLISVSSHDAKKSVDTLSSAKETPGRPASARISMTRDPIPRVRMKPWLLPSYGEKTNLPHRDEESLPEKAGEDAA